MALKPHGHLKLSMLFSRSMERGNTQIDWSDDRYASRGPRANAPLEHLQYFRRPSLDRLGVRIGLKRITIPAIVRNYYVFQKSVAPS